MSWKFQKRSELNILLENVLRKLLRSFENFRKNIGKLVSENPRKPLKNCPKLFQKTISDFFKNDYV